MASIANYRQLWLVCLIALAITSSASSSKSQAGKNEDANNEPHPLFKPPQLPENLEYSEPLYGDNGWVPSSADFKPFTSPHVEVPEENAANRDEEVNGTPVSAEKQELFKQRGIANEKRKSRAVVRPIVAPYTDVAEGRQFFNPLRNYISPVAGIFNPTGITNPYALNSLLVARGQIPLIASATLTNNAATGLANVGTVIFFQKNAASNVIVMASGSGLMNTNAGTLTVYSNPIPAAAGTNGCGTSGLGAIFNPNVVTGGGVISSAVAVAGTNMQLYVDSVQPNIFTLWRPSGIIGRSIRYSIPATATALEQDVYCGTIKDI